MGSEARGKVEGSFIGANDRDGGSDVSGGDDG